MSTRKTASSPPCQTLLASVIDSAAAVASSSIEALATSRPVKSVTTVWKANIASNRPCEISGWYGVYAVYQEGFSKTLRRITGGVIVPKYPRPIKDFATTFSSANSRSSAIAATSEAAAGRVFAIFSVRAIFSVTTLLMKSNKFVSPRAPSIELSCASSGPMCLSAKFERTELINTPPKLVEQPLRFLGEGNNLS